MPASDTRTERFEDRVDAGKRLAETLRGSLHPDALLLGLPRGGVVVAAAIASELDLPASVYVVRKLRAPINPEFAIGALAEDGAPIWDRQSLTSLRVDEKYMDREVAEQSREIARRIQEYRSHELDLTPDRPVVVVDDGIATGATVEAALVGLRMRGCARLTVAAPVASSVAVARLRPLCEDVVTVVTSQDFFAVGEFYARFGDVTDVEVRTAANYSPPPEVPKSNNASRLPSIGS